MFALALTILANLPPATVTRTVFGTVRVEQFGECQCPLTSSWFSAFYEGCLEGR